MFNHCDRCRKEAQITTMSFFNTDIICMECGEKEQNHPKYKEAKEAEVQAVANGDYNFPGIGKPSDLT